jgi:hypothetical protein
MSSDQVRRIFWALVALKLALSASLLLGYLDSPFGAGLSLDEESYFARAQTILAGDLIGRAPMFQDPLYPYVLAAVLLAARGSLILCHLFNLALGLLSLVLLERVVRRLFSPALGLVAMGLWMLVGSAAIDELTLSKEPLMTVLLLGSAVLALEVEGRRPSLAFAAGALAGALPLVRGNFLIGVPIGVCLAYRWWPRRVASATAIGLILFPALFALRNGVIEGRWLPSTSSTGMLLFIGHHPEADGTWTRAPFATGTPLSEMPDYVREASRRLGRPASSLEASGLFGAESFQFMRDHPADELRLLIRKVRLSLSWEEVPGNYSRSCLRDRFIPELWLAPLPGAILWPFALAGFIAHRRRREVQLIGAASLIYLATLWASFIVERYRLPLWVACAVLSPAGLVALGQWARSTRRAALIAAAIPVGVLLCWPVRSAGLELEQCLALAGATLLEAGRSDEAQPLLLEATQLAPQDSESSFNLGFAYESSGKWPEAAASYRRSIEANPRNWAAWWGLGICALELEDPEATRAFEVFFSGAPREQVDLACSKVGAEPSLGWISAKCRAK